MRNTTDPQTSYQSMSKKQKQTVQISANDHGSTCTLGSGRKALPKTFVALLSLSSIIFVQQQLLGQQSIAGAESEPFSAPSQQDQQGHERSLGKRATPPWVEQEGGAGRRNPEKVLPDPPSPLDDDPQGVVSSDLDTEHGLTQQRHIANEEDHRQPRVKRSTNAEIVQQNLGKSGVKAVGAGLGAGSFGAVAGGGPAGGLIGFTLGALTSLSKDAKAAYDEGKSIWQRQELQERIKAASRAEWALLLTSSPNPKQLHEIRKTINDDQDLSPEEKFVLLSLYPDLKERDPEERKLTLAVQERDPEERKLTLVEHFGKSYVDNFIPGADFDPRKKFPHSLGVTGQDAAGALAQAGMPGKLAESASSPGGGGRADVKQSPSPLSPPRSPVPGRLQFKLWPETLLRSISARSGKYNINRFPHSLGRQEALNLLSPAERASVEKNYEFLPHEVLRDKIARSSVEKGPEGQVVPVEEEALLGKVIERYSERQNVYESWDRGREAMLKEKPESPELYRKAYDYLKEVKKGEGKFTEHERTSTPGSLDHANALWDMGRLNTSKRLTHLILKEGVTKHPELFQELGLTAESIDHEISSSGAGALHYNTEAIKAAAAFEEGRANDMRVADHYRVLYDITNDSSYRTKKFDSLVKGTRKEIENVAKEMGSHDPSTRISALENMIQKRSKIESLYSVEGENIADEVTGTKWGDVLLTLAGNKQTGSTQMSVLMQKAQQHYQNLAERQSELAERYLAREDEDYKRLSIEETERMAAEAKANAEQYNRIAGEIKDELASPNEERMRRLAAEARLRLGNDPMGARLDNFIVNEKLNTLHKQKAKLELEAEKAKLADETEKAVDSYKKAKEVALAIEKIRKEDGDGKYGRSSDDLQKLKEALENRSYDDSAKIKPLKPLIAQDRENQALAGRLLEIKELETEGQILQSEQERKVAEILETRELTERTRLEGELYHLRIRRVKNLQQRWDKVNQLKDPARLHTTEVEYVNSLEDVLGSQEWTSLDRKAHNFWQNTSLLSPTERKAALLRYQESLIRDSHRGVNESPSSSLAMEPQKGGYRQDLTQFVQSRRGVELKRVEDELRTLAAGQAQEGIENGGGHKGNSDAGNSGGEGRQEDHGSSGSGNGEGNGRQGGSSGEGNGRGNGGDGGEGDGQGGDRRRGGDDRQEAGKQLPREKMEQKVQELEKAIGTQKDQLGNLQGQAKIEALKQLKDKYSEQADLLEKLGKREEAGKVYTEIGEINNEIDRLEKATLSASGSTRPGIQMEGLQARRHAGEGIQGAKAEGGPGGEVPEPVTQAELGLPPAEESSLIESQGTSTATKPKYTGSPSDESATPTAETKPGLLKKIRKEVKKFFKIKSKRVPASGVEGSGDMISELPGIQSSMKDNLRKDIKNDVDKLEGEIAFAFISQAGSFEKFNPEEEKKLDAFRTELNDLRILMEQSGDSLRLIELKDIKEDQESLKNDLRPFLRPIPPSSKIFTSKEPELAAAYRGFISLKKKVNEASSEDILNRQIADMGGDRGRYGDGRLVSLLGAATYDVYNMAMKVKGGQSLSSDEITNLKEYKGGLVDPVLRFLYDREFAQKDGQPAPSARLDLQASNGMIDALRRMEQKGTNNLEFEFSDKRQDLFNLVTSYANRPDLKVKISQKLLNNIKEDRISSTLLLLSRMWKSWSPSKEESRHLRYMLQEMMDYYSTEQRDKNKLEDKPSQEENSEDIVGTYLEINNKPVQVRKEKISGREAEGEFIFLEPWMTLTSTFPGSIHSEAFSPQGDDWVKHPVTRKPMVIFSDDKGTEFVSPPLPQFTQVMRLKSGKIFVPSQTRRRYDLKREGSTLYVERANGSRMNVIEDGGKLYINRGSERLEVVEDTVKNIYGKDIPGDSLFVKDSVQAIERDQHGLETVFTNGKKKRIVKHNDENGEPILVAVEPDDRRKYRMLRISSRSGRSGDRIVAVIPTDQQGPMRLETDARGDYVTVSGLGGHSTRLDLKTERAGYYVQSLSSKSPPTGLVGIKLAGEAENKEFVVEPASIRSVRQLGSDPGRKSVFYKGDIYVVYKGTILRGRDERNGIPGTLWYISIGKSYEVYPIWFIAKGSAGEPERVVIGSNNDDRDTDQENSIQKEYTKGKETFQLVQDPEFPADAGRYINSDNKKQFIMSNGRATNN